MARQSGNLSNNLDPYKDIQPKVTNFNTFLPWACNELSIGADVIVTRATQEVYERHLALAKKGLSRKNLVTRKLITDDRDSDDVSVKNLKSSSIELENAVRIKTLYDGHENLVDIKFLQNKTIPRQIMQVIGLAIPYHKHLTSIAINSGLDMETLYEIAKFLPDSNITELCLDNTFLTNANYHILLTQGKLRHLSLARCSINDVILKTITDQLGAASPASRVLSALNLSSNRITDVGAKYIAGMLRTNRQLSYLNIAGNMITDEGGMSILDTLQKFPLEAKEIRESKVKYVAYLKKRNQAIETRTKQFETTDRRPFGKKSLLKGADASTIRQKAESLAETKIKPFNYHFSPQNTESQDGVLRCLGNNTLCYLNLAYNNLTYVSVRKLRDVLVTQKSLTRTPRGLIKVVIEGNLMPVACEEYDEINRLFKNNVPASNVKTKSKKER